MIATRIVTVNWDRKLLMPILCLAAYGITAGIALQDFIDPTSLHFLLGLLALPFTFTCRRNQQAAYGWALASAACSLLCFLMPVKTILFFSIGFAGFFLARFFGKAPTLLSAGVLLLMAPAFQYIANVFSFPVRLALARCVGWLFQFAAPHTVTEGAVIHHNGAAFSVDLACVGLNMLTASLLLAIMFLGHYQKAMSRSLHWYSVFLFMAVVVGLNIISNLMRIFLLVHFAILPEDAMHEVVGALCLMLYAALPAAWLAKRIAARARWAAPVAPAFNIGKFAILGYIALLAFIGTASYGVAQGDTYHSFQAFAARRITGYSVAQQAPGILKVENGQSLTYIKYIRGFFDIDHNPTICWKGSGYQFENIAKRQFHGQELYTAHLVNGTERLYTAWCYSNGRRFTTSQMAWRRDMLKKKTVYAIVNITTATPAALDREVNRVLQQHSLKSLFDF